MGIFNRLRAKQPSGQVGGLLGYYGLGDWWLATFSPTERQDLEYYWTPLDANKPLLAKGQVTSNVLSTPEFLLVLQVRAQNESVRQRVLTKVRELTNGQLPGYVKGEKYTGCMERAKELIRAGKQQAADALVSAAFDAYEAVSRIGLSLTEYDTVPPAPYWDFAVLYRRQKDYAREVGILERFLRQSNQPRGKSDDFLARLDKARALLAASRISDEG